MQEGSSDSELSHGRWDLGIIGKRVDDRGTAATDFIRTYCDRVASLEYHADEFTVDLDGSVCDVEEFRANPLFGTTPILLETTTLGFVEILLGCDSSRKLKGTVDLLYVEPVVYKLSGRTPLLHRRDFELSDEVPGYRGIPGFTLLLEQGGKVTCVFFLGYEERRLDRALEDFPFLRPDRCYVAFGVPAFRAGWEMDAFANNVRVIRERDLRGGVHFCGAENPLAVLETLNRVKQGLSQNDRLLVAPIGTKPFGIGVALFALENPGTGVLYDHPSRRQERSENVGNWHLYSVRF